MDIDDGLVNLLVVDDNRDALLTLGILLRSEGYIVDLASSGTEALATASTRPPHAVLMDLKMPKPNGFEVARELHLRHGAECPLLIAVTANTDADHRQEAERSGFDEFVGKPYDPQALLLLLNGLKRRSRGTRRL